MFATRNTIIMDFQDTSEVGKWGETVARNYLEQKGYIILETNWHSSHREIDIIAQIKQTIVIVEVKTRTSTYINPADAVNRQKQKLLIAAANCYMKIKNLDADIRFDIISIISKKNEVKIEHIQNAFYPQISR